MKGFFKLLIICVCTFVLCFDVFAQQHQDALQLYNAGKYAESVKVCETEIASKKYTIDSFVVLGWSLIRLRRYSEAEQRAAEALKIAPNDVRIIEIDGEAKYYQGKNQAALVQFEKYIALTTDNGPRIGAAYYYMGEIYVRLAKYNHADIALSASVRKEPLRDLWWARLGYAREMSKNYKGASVAYDQSLSLNPSQADAVLGKRRVTSHL
ncbi:MAG: hypothetical protein K6E51_00815 [Treponema sp.]|nr:hypothetical protein [Treponema sp.]